MSYTTEQLLTLATQFDELSINSLQKAAAKKKLDPKAKVRNKGTVCVPAESAKDKKDHFPINDEGQARNALARVHQYSSAPSWYKGSLKGLQDLVSRKVHSKYPSIGKSDKKSKKSFLEEMDGLVSLAQQLDMEEAPTPQKLAENAMMNETNPITGRVPGAGRRYIDGLRDQGHISDKKHNEVLTMYQAMMAAKHPRKASLEEINLLLSKYAAE